ncbi:MAG TPA: T9SS type A sorting domain-containing protein [Hanamia sp.]|nr:T9SS type A sorting domain-containing protein [Hanamia sp.]
MKAISMRGDFYSFILNGNVWITASFVFLFNFSYGQTDVLTNHNDLKRTGWNNKETILATDNVSSGNFGKIFSRDVDDQIYAQPLVVSNVPIGGGTHNIVLVATVNNTLYAFDADDPNASNPYWKDNLTKDPKHYRPVNNTDMSGACGGNYKDFSGNMGIVGTPVIDSSTKTLYVVSRSVTKASPQNFVQTLHAINVTTGNEKPGSPVEINASFPGSGDGSVGGVINFDPQKQNQRPGLLLYNGIVYISWASHCDWSPYHGWIIGYDANTLQQKYVYNDTPGGGLAGIWMSGQAPSVDDDGNIYVTTGNGTTGVGTNPNDTSNRGSSLVKLSPELKVEDFFTPSNYQYLNSNDRDYGCTGVFLMPNTHLSLSGSKDGGSYLIDNDNMGGMKSDNSNVLQRLNFGDWGTVNSIHLYGSPVYYKDAYNNEYIYGWAAKGLLKQIPFDRSKMLFDTVNAKVGITVLPSGYLPGGILAVSSNGSQEGSAILWASRVSNGNPNQATVPGMLQAFDAEDVTHELWNSNWNSKRDSIGNYAKFVPPTIANGKVYMATFSNKLNVYGLNPPPASPCTNTLPPTWQSADIGYVANAGDVCVDKGTYSITASGDDIWNTKDAFHFVFQKVITDETELTARIVSVKATSSYAKCGIMFRQNLDPGSPFVFLSVFPTNKMIMLERTDQSANAISVSDTLNNSAPYWIRIYNKGNKYISYTSSNGTDWTILDSVTLSLGTNPYVGIAYTTRNNSILDTAIVDNVALRISGALDVNLINFNGKNIDNKKTVLNWITGREINNDHFEIQRSSSNTDFVKIATIKDRGTSSGDFNYSFTDNSPQDGKNYYRLKLVGKNGNVSYSSIVLVKFNFRKILIYPNPASNKIYITNNLNFSKGKSINFQLLDFGGKTLYKKDYQTNDVDIITFNIPSKIPNGMYVLIVTNSEGYKEGEQIFINR